MDLDWIASQLGARKAQREQLIQSLWSGYGELVRVRLDGGRAPTAIVKWVRPPADALERKLRSYEVETAFYRSLAPRCDATCRVPTLYAAREHLLVLEDLDAAGFNGRTDEASDAQLDATLRWLASFHARFLGERFDTVWPQGTYWTLELRRDELAAIEDAKLRDAAPALAQRLATARYQTLLHGDAKDANFCFSRTSDVAAVDFQYTGHGPGIIDVAYLLYGRSDEPDTGIDTERLDAYFRYLAAPPAVEAEWRALYPIARLDFCRFLAGWRPTMWRRDTRGQRFVRGQTKIV